MGVPKLGQRMEAVVVGVLQLGLRVVAGAVLDLEGEPMNLNRHRFVLFVMVIRLDKTVFSLASSRFGDSRNQVSSFVLVELCILVLVLDVAPFLLYDDMFFWGLSRSSFGVLEPLLLP